MLRKIIIAEPHGFCTGVMHAIDIAERAILNIKAQGKIAPGSPLLYCLHELVHNRMVVDKLTANGVVFVKSLDNVPNGGTILFSAHGVSPDVRKNAILRGLNVIDATCVFVNKVHEAVRKYATNGYSIILIGNKRHDEVLGVAGEATDSVIVVENEAEAKTVIPRDPDKVAVVTQTTLTIAQAESMIGILKSRFPKLVVPAKSGICYATTNRQDAVRKIAKEADIVIVLGSCNSANSNRLVEVARAEGVCAELVPDIATLRTAADSGVFDDAEVIGLTAGASTPEYIMEEARMLLENRIKHLKSEI